MRARRTRTAESNKTAVMDEGFFNVNLSSAFSVTTTLTSRYVTIEHLRSDDDGQPMPRTLRECDGAASQHESTWTSLRNVQRAICFNVPLEFARCLDILITSPSPSTTASPAPPSEALTRRYYNHCLHPATQSHPPSMRSALADSSDTASTSGRRNSLRRTKELLHRDQAREVLLFELVHTLQLARGQTPARGHRRAQTSTPHAGQTGRGHRCKKGNADDHWVCVEIQHKVKQRLCVVSL
ncbi:hypothetical protein VTO73DRAFT_6921 [Trametes versicolor]